MLSDPVFVSPAVGLHSVVFAVIATSSRRGSSPEMDVSGPFASSAFLTQEQ